jgi:hypothetical protein
MYDHDKLEFKKWRNISSLTILLFFIFMQIVCIGIGTPLASSGNELFEEAVPADSADVRKPVQPTIVRSKFVKVNFDLLLDQNVGQADAPLILNFFDDVSFSATMDRVEVRSEDNYTWFGTLKDIDLGHVVLSVVDGDLSGNVSFPGGFYQIRSMGSGYYSVSEIDQSVFPDEAPPLEPPSGAESPADGSTEMTPDAGALLEGVPDEEGSGVEAPADDGSLIDILVVYTAAAAAASSNILSEIQLAIDETNQAYANSGVYHRVNLAGTAQVSYTETGNSSTDLSRLRGTSDGYMDNVHSLRNSYRADQVTLIVETLDACGRGYRMSTVSADFEDDAFTVVDRGCATGYYSFGHELGHTMSAHHDCYVESSVQPYNYIHGYVHIGRTAASSWRTIMAYRDECEDTFSGADCTRIQYFSNPSVSYGGYPTGTSGSGCTANVRLTFANTDYTVSNFRSGQCKIYGYVERVSVNPGNASSYIYTRSSARSNYYVSFTTSDAKLIKAALHALPGRTYVHVIGNQSCFDDRTDSGGDATYIAVSP